MTVPLLEVKDLKKHFVLHSGLLGKSAATVSAVDGVSFAIDKGETLALVGESGCGKSTVGRCILRLFEITAGQVILDGQRIDDLSPAALRPLRRRMQVVRNFCLYRRRDLPAAFVPDERLFPSEHQVIRPHLFTEAEVLRLLDLVKALPSALTSPLRRENLHLAIVILYTTGLRLGELVRLTLRDYDSRSQTLLIRDSKFHKSRLVPLSMDGVREIESSARRLLLEVCDERRLAEYVRPRPPRLLC